MSKPDQARVDAIVRAVGELLVPPADTPLREVIQAWRPPIDAYADEASKVSSGPAADEVLRRVVLTVLEAAIGVLVEDLATKQDQGLH